MKNKTKLFVVLVAFLGLSVFVGQGAAHALSFRTGDNVTVGQTEKVDHTLFVAGNNVDINAEVYGDIFCAGQNVRISGVVHGDVICAGQTVNVSGTVDGDVRLAGQTVTLSATVNGNASVGGQTFTLDSGGKVKGDAVIGASSSIVNGSIGRDIALGGQSVVVNGAVGRDIRAGGENIELGPAAKIGGNVEYDSTNKITLRDGATVKGSTKQNIPKEKSSPKRGAVFGFAILWFLYLLVAMLLVALVFAFLFPRYLFRVTDRAVKAPWKALLVGVVAGLLAPIVFILSMISVVGIPLGLIAGLGWMLILALSGPVSAFYLGRKVMSTNKSAPLAMIVGGTVLLILYFIPFVGFLFMLAAGSLGTGLILQELFNRDTSVTKTKPAKA